MTAFYNEIDPYAAQWLRNLIAAGHIAPGVVDERSIIDIYPEDLRGYTQCHFFAGVGVWSYALRRAGWPDDRPVWTGSCPCQPFSAAGQGNGFADERHLWPHFHWLIEQCGPAVVIGEQVASKDADPWIDLVHTDLEALGYAFGAIPFPSAGIGAPHIRDRLYWVANAYGGAGGQRGAELRGWADGSDAQPWAGLGSSGAPCGLAHGDRQRRDGQQILLQPRRPQQTGAQVAGGGGACRPGDTDDTRLEGFGGGHQAEGGRLGTIRPAAAAGELGGLADAILLKRPGGQPTVGDEHAAGGRLKGATAAAGLRDDLRPGPTNGYWADADWLGCRDGKWRPVEPGTFPLAHGAASRVGRLRAYGNAINAEAARVFVQAVMESL